ncbi:uncharacterized protein MISP3 [Hyla sarda]|uniref:uncharacterized protein MISP3 n=1 Tax=Hyla sarda TaxID=327740 RepID=UPI0024C30A1D|nr:uncharacterized protein MISP3 [Hyla sarda]XP_056426250.1 uncharacterized protein MISP3 [Hyla sarda]XP_056426251.1 uncharacterized protein MISP3 [Hyla sarda]
MASEQKLPSTDENQSSATTATSIDTIHPSHDSKQPSSCASDNGLQGEPETHPVTTSPEDRREQVEGTSEGYGGITGGEQVGGDGAGKEEKTTEEKVTCDDAPHQVTDKGALGNEEEVPVGILVSVEESSPLEEGADQPAQVTGEETEELGTRGQTTGDKEEPQETRTQETGEETEEKGTGDEKEEQDKTEETCPQSTGEGTGPQNKDEESAPQVTIPEISEPQGSDEESAPQVTDTGVDQNAQMSSAGEKWIDMMVHTIVTEVTGDGVCTGEQEADVEAADSITVMKEGEEHSSIQETGTMTGEQVTLQGAGAAVQVTTDGEVSTYNTDIALQVRAEDAGAEQVTGGTAGIDTQVEETASHREDSAGAQVTATAEEVLEEVRRDLEAGGQVIASGAEADREVTPDLNALPGREEIIDPDQPVACREKEWPSLICTASEVRTVTEEQGDSQQGSVTPKEPSAETSDMKEREIGEDVYTANPETPIEREIRLTMEREMTLRQERGISSPVGNPEFVEVRRRTISVEPAAVFGKERQLAGVQMQREIQLETQRERDLVELGKVMGTYDRGPQQELQERKMIFESMNTEPSDVPIKKKQSESQQQPTPQEAPPSNIPESTNHVLPARETKKGPSYTEANGSNVIIIEHSNMLRRSVLGNASSSAPADSRRSTPADYYRSAPADSSRSTPAETSRTNWSGSPLPNSADSPVPPGSPYQLLRSPSPRSLLEQEIEEVKERERELQRQRSSIYGRDDSARETTQKKQEVTSDVQSVYQPERPNWRKLEVNWPPNKEAAQNGQQQVSDSPRSRPQRIALIKSWESGTPNPKDDE